MLIVKNSPANAGDIRDIGSIPWSGRSPGGEHGIPLQYSCLDNPMDRGAWQAIVHGVAKSQAWLKQLSLHTHEKYLAEYPYKDTKKKKEDNISKFKNRWIFQKKKCWNWANEKSEPKSCPELKQNKQTRTKFNEPIASMIEDHKTKMQNSGERWPKFRKRWNCAQKGKYKINKVIHIYYFQILSHYRLL